MRGEGTPDLKLQDLKLQILAPQKPMSDIRPFDQSPNCDATSVIVDWSLIRSEEDFYDSILKQCGSPSWHGRNLDALADSWITGGIDTQGPPYAFGFRASDAVAPNMIEFRDAVEEIARESVAENGGRYNQEENSKSQIHPLITDH